MEETTETKQEESNKTEKKDNQKGKDNVIFIGGKPFMNYVSGVTIQLKNNNEDEVIVKARGKFISKAVDVCEVARKRFLQDMPTKIKDVKIDSEEFENKEGKRVNVSTIEITVAKE